MAFLPNKDKKFATYSGGLFKALNIDFGWSITLTATKYTGCYEMLV